MSFAEKKKKCIEFVLVTLGIFLSGFMMYGMLGSMEGMPVVVGLAGGYFLASIYCGGYAVVTLVKKWPLTAKVIVGFLLFIVILLAMLFGVFAVIPMLVIKTVQFIKYGRLAKMEETLKTEEQLALAEEGEAVTVKKKSKDVIIAAIILLVLAIVAVSAVVAVGKNMNKMAALDEYTVSDYSVAAITKVVGERRVMDVDVNESTLTSSKRYTYGALGNALEDVEAYVNYLIDNENFKLGKNEAGYITVYKYVGDNDRLDVSVNYTEVNYSVEIAFTDR